MFRMFKDGVDDLVMVSSPSNSEITGQLGARFDREIIYTNIGDVLIAINPYRYLPITGDEHIRMYQFSTGNDTPPHIFQLAERAYRRLTDDGESQCVIISGESGAGKTVSAKLILNFVTAVSPGSGISGANTTTSNSNASSLDSEPSRASRALPSTPVTNPGGPPGRGSAPGIPGVASRGATRGPPPAINNRGGAPGTPPQQRGGGATRRGPISVEQIKRVILDSNPLMEAIGNAKTVRNDNSSRFGKYLEIQFDERAAPLGGVISTFLLEKTRVAFQQRNERNFHIFYQLIRGLDAAKRSEFGLSAPDNFYYLSQSGCTTVEEVDDANDFKEVCNAMNTIGISQSDQMQIFQILAGILHVGNIRFEGDAPARITNRDAIEWAANLLGVEANFIHQSLNHRQIQTGSARATQYAVPQNAEQSTSMRDALAKTLYDRIFDYIVNKINEAMALGGNNKVIGVLDIYGFEVFERNSFEQFCINYVNERLQQIFIELTVRGEQREYHDEGINWRDITFFDNKIVCDLIEGQNPPGIMRVLDDTCRVAHSLDSATVDSKFMEKLIQGFKQGHAHLQITKTDSTAKEFTIIHYAGEVTYTVDEFCFKNNDNLYTSIVCCMQSSSLPFMQARFPENIADAKSAPTTAGFKIRQSAGHLVKRLSACTPHYIRCIKPNDRKQPMSFVGARVEHQVKYLGLLENVKVKRAGFAYRHFKEIFLRRFGQLLEPKPGMPNNIGEFVNWVRANVKEINPEEFVEGKSKIFIRSPETLFVLEEMLMRKLDPEGYRLKIKAFKEQERLAQQKAGKHSLKTKCLIQ
eukprot:TRINITY_DN580_c0_g1_i1.p1 TRINITY_DN580_c0_g1~~TRINITY_DN580_c0_g1_i1.p1  ORF type:complete len:824 (+),score=434.13 TRINITY_DN580_c0_g1_i1:48-2474(+)